MGKNDKNKIWFTAPAFVWEQVHPIGNGNLGAMIWGTEEEKLGLNLDTLWSGVARDTNNYHAREYLQPVRKKIFAGDYTEAAKLVEQHLLGEFGENYLPMGNLFIRAESRGADKNSSEIKDNAREQHSEKVQMDEGVLNNEGIQDYKRVLDLNKGIATISYCKGNTTYEREYFASYPDHLIGIRYASSEKMNLQFSLESELRPVMEKVSNGLRMSGQCPEHVEPSYLESDHPIIWGTKGIRFVTELHVTATDGIVESDGEHLFVKNATYCELALQAASGTRECPLQVKEIPAVTKSYEEQKAAHIKDYRELFDRVKLDLGEVKGLPTDQRLQCLKEGKDDPDLYALFFQYGRYLLLSSSREGTEAANLQGIWNWEMRAPWSSNYTTNINVEMNYWPAQICNLAECMEPYFSLLKDLSISGRKTAQVHFGCRGFCVGHNTDFWRITNPVGVPYGKEGGVEGSSLYAFFVLSGQWMCQELWKAYEYQKNLDFLKEFAYPILKEAAFFTIDWLVEYKDRYVTCPSASPENQFRTETGISPISMGTTMDMTIVREIFNNYEKAYLELEKQKVLSKEQIEEGQQVLAEINERREKLPPYQIGEDGRLLEWIYPFEETEPGHRHISHAYGLFPGEEFRQDERLKETCRKSIEYRLSHGGGHTGWSCAWIANLYAILGDGEQAYVYMKTLLTKSICDNLWTSHPPFQIDANFAGTMAMAQMFVQEMDDEVKILPAIPKAWKKGSVEGLCLHGNKTIDIQWEGEDITYQIRPKE